MTKTNTTTPTAPNPGRVWRTIIEDVEMTQTQVAKAGIPSAPMTIKFAQATDSSIEEQWQIVADYMLAQAIAAAKPVPAKKAPAKAPAKKAAPAKRAAAHKVAAAK